MTKPKATPRPEAPPAPLKTSQPPKELEATAKYLTALGAYDDAMELLGWPENEGLRSYFRVPGKTGPQAVVLAKSLGFPVEGFVMRSSKYPSSWLVIKDLERWPPK